eukprot:CAMPEP_0168750046 /NCGR_PEP_ID=MMETSP0724-20121128/17050_1 /TAXON_ID=265536 /ORGANISM="Amphiprora sp., Strain CCMP467" /LENGTH=252 /DNA_ID=CAMNT_0008798015 /DNA_START=25 /DNA_END=783 /DNA_ORIENTATION=-
MKLCALVALNLAASTPAAYAFQVVQPQATTTTTTTTALDMSSHHIITDPNELSDNRNEEILKALGNMEGPSISYGHFAVMENKKPTDIKEYDNFDAFKAAIDQADCTKLLRGNGPFTVFAPTNTAIENFDGVLTEEVILTHIIPQDLYSDELQGEFETMSGHKVKCETKFRKIYVDSALIGQLDNHSGGTPYPTNAICTNGVIHAINTVLTPGYEATVGDAQAVQGLSLQAHFKQDVLKERGALPSDASDKH